MQRGVFIIIGLLGVMVAVCIFLTVNITLKAQRFTADLNTTLQTSKATDSEDTDETEEDASTSEEGSSAIVVEVVTSQGTQGEVAEEEYAGEQSEDITWQTAEQTETVTEQTSTQITRYIFVGDSRYVGMSRYAQDEDYFIARVGAGYEYLVSQLDAIRAAVIPGSVLIIGLGVNDYKAEKYDLYIQTINELAQTLDAKVYYTLVNPVDEALEAQNGYDLKNTYIEAFNAALQAGLDSSITIIDTNSFLKSDGYVTTDGLHYDNATYQKIYQYIKAQIS